MSQLSQFSEGGLSDIISDVDKFIQDNGINEDVTQLMRDHNVHLVNDAGVEEKYQVPSNFLGNLNGSLQFQFQFPPDQPTNLGTEEYSGPFDFEVLIVPNEQKTPWEYSTKLNKIFIGINLKFPVAFSLKKRPENLSLFVRATPVYSQAQFFQDLVHRCVGHRHPQDPSNKGLPPHIYQHIMRCSNEDARYFGDKNTGARLNIVVPLAEPQVGTDVVKEFYQFVCKNSCALGMNRRPIDVVFTLEDESGEVFGRRLVSVRICSCPKRDKEKEEKDPMKANGPPQAKKRKFGVKTERREVPQATNSIDTRVFSLNFNVIGKNNYLHMLKTCRSLMASEIVRMEGQNDEDSPFRNCYNEMTTLISKVATE